MTAWRVWLTAVFLAVIGVPLAVPVVHLLAHPEGWQAWEDLGRQRDLLRNTLLLVAGTLAVAMPLGIAAACLLHRSDLPLSGLLCSVTVLALFVPLPLFASAWQATLGSGGWLISLGWIGPDAESGWQPWVQGLGAAVWVHAMAGLPWVVWIVGQGLSRVERDLEEEALLSAPPLRVLLAVTLPRCKAALAAAALVVALQTANEITVTDLMMVRTFSEEVYLQFTIEGLDVLARAAAVSLPAVLLLMVLILRVVDGWEQSLPPLQQLAPPVCLFPLGKARWPVLLLVLIGLGLLSGVPIGGLIWKTGLGGSPETWSAERYGQQLEAVFTGKGILVIENLLLAAAAGGSAMALALLSSWLAVESRWFRTAMLVLMAWALAMPGCLVGMGLKQTIVLLVAAEQLAFPGDGLLRLALYDGPSVLPLLWVSLIRFWPFAAAILWPALRSIPVELRESARLDGARPVDELLRIAFPLTRPACWQATVGVAVLSLGELSAGKLVETPGSTTLAHVIFEQMHRGVPSDVAALCLLLLIMVVATGTLVALGRLQRGHPTQVSSLSGHA